MCSLFARKWLSHTPRGTRLEAWSLTRTEHFCTARFFVLRAALTPQSDNCYHSVIFQLSDWGVTGQAGGRGGTTFRDVYENRRERVYMYIRLLYKKSIHAFVTIFQNTDS